VKPYVKTNKNDYIDAEAIAEAVTRPTMRFVPIKTDDQLDLQSLHRIRERWVKVEMAKRSIPALPKPAHGKCLPRQRN
jgi:transposase